MSATPAKRILVCGGRRYADRHVMMYFLDALVDEFGEIDIGVGYDPNDKRYQGADQIAYEWAKGRGIQGRCYPAHWKAIMHLKYHAGALHWIH